MMNSLARFSHEDIPDFLNMAEYCLAQQAQILRNKLALVVIHDPNLTSPPEEQWTYGDLETAVLKISSGLSDLGLRCGDRLLIRLDNTSTYPLVFFASIAAGLVSIATSSQLTSSEATFIHSDCMPHAIVLSDHLPRGSLPENIPILSENKIRQMIDHGIRGSYAKTRSNDPAYMLYTSGTTAQPKGVIHAHRVVLGRAPTYQGWYGFKPNDVMLHAGAFNWTYTLGTGLIDPWANGLTSTIYVGQKNHNIWPHIIRKSNSTLFAAVPTLFRQILKYSPIGWIDLGKLRHGLIAGEAPSPSLFTDWSARTGTELYEALGMTEISTYISSHPGMERKIGSAGRAQPGRKIAILPVEDGIDPLPAGSVGLLAVNRSDPGLMLGYWNRADEEKSVYRGNWFIGGDLAVIDEDNYVFHHGRTNEVMKVLGYRVSPFEVETVLSQHPDLAEIACTEICPREGVSIIGAFVVLKPDHTLNRNSIEEFLQDRLSLYKQPKEYIVVKELPRTSNGKIKRSELRKMYENRKTNSHEI